MKVQNSKFLDRARPPLPRRQPRHPPCQHGRGANRTKLPYPSTDRDAPPPRPGPWDLPKTRDPETPKQKGSPRKQRTCSPKSHPQRNPKPHQQPRTQQRKQTTHQEDGHSHGGRPTHTHSHNEKIRLPDGPSIFTAESKAIDMALDYVMNNSLENKFVIFSDSLSVLKSLNHTSSKIPKSRT